MGWSEHAGLIHPHHEQRNGLEIRSQRWIRELNLSDQQMHEVNSVLDDFGHYYDNLIADGQTRIRQILTPEQRRKFDQMIQAGAAR